MRCPTLAELPPPPPGRVGWPWTVAAEPATTEVALPRVTIVTPSFNQGAYLEETLRSVLLQGYPDLEYIVIDGGSTDESVGIIQKYAPWLTYWVSERDRGQADAINKGFRRATGAFVNWLNSDDVFYPGALHDTVAFLDRHPDVDFVYRDVEQGWERERVELRRGEAIAYPEMIRTFQMPIPQQACLWRRSIMDRVGLLDPKWHVVLDREFFMRIGLHGRLAYAPGVVGYFRLHGASKSIAEERHWLQEIPQLYAEFFARPDLPEPIRRLRGEATSAAYIFCARIARGHGAPLDAMRWIVKAVASYPAALKKLFRWGPAQVLQEAAAFFRRQRG